MKVSQLAFEYAGKILIPKLWFDVKNSVAIAEQDKNASGQDKKAFVISRMKELGYDLAVGLLDFAIQLAWMWLQAKMGHEILAEKDKTQL